MPESTGERALPPNTESHREVPRDSERGTAALGNSGVGHLEVQVLPQLWNHLEFLQNLGNLQRTPTAIATRKALKQALHAGVLRSHACS